MIERESLHLDFETFSEADIKKVGAWAYANHPSTEVLCCAYAEDGHEPCLWLPGDPAPFFVQGPFEYQHFAHNSFFEFCIWKYVLAGEWGEPPPFGYWTDTAAEAAALALPRSLAEAGKAVGLPADKQKDQRGKYLIERLCKPYRGKRLRDPELLLELYEYCKQDVVAEREVSKRLIRLSADERRVWELDQAVNLRGIPIDREAVRNAIAIVDQRERDNATRVQTITGRALENTNSPLQFQDFCLNRYGYRLESCQKQYLLDVLREDIHPEMRELIEIRLAASKSSVKKYQAIEAISDVDGRAHGTLLYHGAQPGRWTGRHLQPQNLKRPEFDDTDECVALFEHRDPELLDLLYGDAMAALSSTVRGAIKAAPGHRLIWADFSAIEGRLVAWQAGQEDKLEVYRTHGKAYEYTAGQIYHVPWESIRKGSDERQIGKVAELALGFQGGWKAFVSMGATYGIDMEDVVTKATPEQWRQIREIQAWAYEHRTEEVTFADGETIEIPLELTDGQAFAELIKRNWREANPYVVAYWSNIQDAALLATENPGTTYRVGFVAYRVVRDTLFCRLPSGRKIAYHHPRKGRNRWGQPALNFVGTDDKGNWVRQQTFGGKLVQNITEGIGRDLLAAAMLRVEAAGYPVVFHVHDELCSEVPDSFGDLDEFEALMCELPPWAEGLPVAAEGFIAERYRK